ncbi:MAG: hypothetical protein II347_05065 [Lachnospiraceae bacterium]|nr:hypothetical protein [Lachnospiraceae bacterium]
MSAKTKIVVLKMKELIYTAVFVGLAILLIAIGWAMFQGSDDTDDKNTNKVSQTTNSSSSERDTNASADPQQYIPGIYTASLPLSGQSLDVEVIVDSAQIKSVRLVNLQESVAAMYPLIEPTMSSLQTQILSSQSVDSITFEDSSKYTAYVLVQAVQTALEKASVQ